MLTLFGVNHRSAPVEMRERLNLSEDQVPDVLRRIRQQEGVFEALVLSTCHRVEVLARMDPAGRGIDVIRDFVARDRSIVPADIDHCSYKLTGLDAVRHVCHVASGLDSMVLGEPQILGQVKDAYEAAREHG